MRKSHIIAALITCASGGLTTSTMATTPPEAFKANLTALNADKIGSEPAGTASLLVEGKDLVVKIQMHGLPPNIEHWEHFHGFVDGSQATCATAAQDTNHDGYIDLNETASVSGTTMVPFNADPAAMDIPTHTYPHASAKGSFTYIKRIPLKELEKKFGQVFKGGHLDLDRRVIYVHGIPESQTLPSTVTSLGPIPAHVTLPIACGKIERVK